MGVLGGREGREPAAGGAGPADDAGAPRRGRSRKPGLRRFVAPHRRLLVAASGFTILESVLALARPWPLKLAVDHAIGDRPLTGWLAPLGRLSPVQLGGVAALLGVGLVAAGALISYLATYLAALGSERTAADIRSAVHRRLLQLSVGFHDRHRSGELTTRLLDDVSRVQDSLSAWLTIVVPEALTLVGMLIVMLLIDVPFALAALSVVPPLALVVAVRRRRIRSAQRVARDEEGTLAAHATDVLRNVRAVQAFGREGHSQQRFDERNRRAMLASVRAMALEARYAPLAEVVLALGAAFVLWLGVVRVTSGRLTLGLLLVVLSYLAGLYDPVRSLSRLSRTLAKAAASRERIEEVLDSDEVVPEPPRPLAVPQSGRLAIDRVWFSYRPGTPVLRGVSLEVEAGETVCIVGPTGAGKSTLLSLLLRFHDPDSGSVRLDTTDLRLLSPAALRRQMALVPQDPWILDGTVAENIAFGRPDATREEIREAARVALVDEFVLDLPDGYDTRVGEAGVLLSGGQRRRLALARAVLRRSPVLLLDEPTSGLDAGAEAQVLEALRQVSAGRTVVMVSHRLGLSAAADRVAVLDHGRVVEQAPPAELLAKGGEYARLWRLQGLQIPTPRSLPLKPVVIENAQRGGEVHGSLAPPPLSLRGAPPSLASLTPALVALRVKVRVLVSRLANSHQRVRDGEDARRPAPDGRNP